MATVVFRGVEGTTRYGTRLLADGDVIECTDQDADALIATGNFVIEKTRKKRKTPKDEPAVEPDLIPDEET